MTTTTAQPTQTRLTLTGDLNLIGRAVAYATTAAAKAGITIGLVELTDLGPQRRFSRRSQARMVLLVSGGTRDQHWHVERIFHTYATGGLVADGQNVRVETD